MRHHIYRMYTTYLPYEYACGLRDQQLTKRSVTHVTCIRMFSSTSPSMIYKDATCCKRHVTLVWLFSDVNVCMSFQCLPLLEWLITHTTFIRPFSCVDPLVFCKVAIHCKRLVTDATCVRHFSSMKLPDVVNDFSHVTFVYGYTAVWHVTSMYSQQYGLLPVCIIDSMACHQYVCTPVWPITS